MITLEGGCMLTGRGVVDNILVLKDDHGVVADGCLDKRRGLGDETGSLAGMATTRAFKKEKVTKQMTQEDGGEEQG
jgi:hypothetical protein